MNAPFSIESAPTSIRAVRASRAALCDVTGRVLARGLNLLGIETLERM